MKGSNAPDGVDAVPVLLQLDRVTLFDMIRTLSQVALQWADYRLKVGQFLFRLFRPNTQDGGPDFLGLALDEFDSVLFAPEESHDGGQDKDAEGG